MTEKSGRRLHGTYTEFDSVDKLLAACRRVRDAGYLKTDAFTPFPVHGIDKALGIKPTILPWICLVAGLTGTTIAATMQIWMNAIDYPYIISGKPYISIPAFIPVCFELTVLLAAFGAFFGMWGLNGLPKFSNPVFTDPRFDRATDDRFFLFIDATDDKYDKGGVAKLFGDFGGSHIDDIYEDTSSNVIPKWIFTTIGILALVSTLPLLILARMRVTNSANPRYHVFYDMDFSPSKDAQQVTTLFADGRAMRPDVPGTVAVGQFDEELDFYTGINMSELAKHDASRATRLVSALVDESDKAAGDAGAVTAPAAGAVEDKTPWLSENPLELSSAVVNRGREKFEIYCAVCHGNDGSGNGLVNRRAQKILSTAWVQPSSLHQDTLYNDKYADGKLFNTITNGIRKMSGYSSQITTRDRWAIVSYVRALQASQNAALGDLPADKRNEIKKQQAEVEKRLEAQAEEDRKKAAAKSS